MPLRIDFDEQGLDQTTRAVMLLPGIFARARKSALKSTGWWIRGEVRNHVEYGGSGWPGLHPLTRKFRKKRGVGAKMWVGRRRGPHDTPLSWLGKFSRYRVDTDGDLLQVDFGKSHRGQPGTVDPQLAGIARRAEDGEKIRVSDQMRKFMGATRRKRPKDQVPGTTYFPLKKSTTQIDIPPRPIFGPVFRKVRGRIPGYFERKFWRAYDRYTRS